MLDRLNEVWTRLGIKPAIGNQLVTVIVLAVANWIAVGGPFEVDSVRAAVAAFLIGVVGVASPPVAGARMTREGIVVDRYADADRPVR
jgi:hypothetical protein